MNNAMNSGLVGSCITFSVIYVTVNLVKRRLLINISRSMQAIQWRRRKACTNLWLNIHHFCEDQSWTACNEVKISLHCFRLLLETRVWNWRLKSRSFSHTLTSHLVWHSQVMGGASAITVLQWLSRKFQMLVVLQDTQRNLYENDIPPPPPPPSPFRTYFSYAAVRSLIKLIIKPLSQDSAG